MERRLFFQGFLIFPRHSPGGKNNDRRNVRLKNVQPIVDLSFVRNNDANRIRRLAALNSCLTQVCLWHTKPDIVALERAVADQDRVCQRALTKQVQLVFPRSKIDRRKFFGGDFTVHCHGEGGANKGPLTLPFHQRENSERSASDLQRSTV